MIFIKDFVLSIEVDVEVQFSTSSCTRILLCHVKLAIQNTKTMKFNLLIKFGLSQGSLVSKLDFLWESYLFMQLRSHLVLWISVEFLWLEGRMESIDWHNDKFWYDMMVKSILQTMTLCISTRCCMKILHRLQIFWPTILEHIFEVHNFHNLDLAHGLRH